MTKIAITAGHSNTDSGAVGQGTTEAKVVTEFRNLVVDAFARRGVVVSPDGYGDVNLPLSAAMRLAEAADIAVEFHCNAASPAATGVETLSAKKDYPLGEKLCEVVSETLGIKNRGAKAEDSGHHSKLGYVQKGGLILELFFITNSDDYAAFQKSKKELADKVADVILSFIDTKS